MSEEEEVIPKFGISLSTLFPDGDPEVEEEEKTEEVEAEKEEVEEEEQVVEEKKEEPKTEPEVKLPPIPDTKEEEFNVDPIEYLHTKWSEHGISKEDLGGDSFKAIVEVVKELREEIAKVKSEKKELENHPAITELKVAQKVEKTWADNIKDWEEELREAIPEEYKLIQKLNKKQSKELLEFISAGSSEILHNRIKGSKNVSNPLLILAPKILNKVKEFSSDKTEPKAQPAPKKMASVSGGAVKPPDQQYIEKKQIAPKMTPAEASFANNINKLFGGM